MKFKTNMKHGDLIFYIKSRKILSKLTSTVTQSDLVHVGIVVEMSGGLWVADSYPSKGCRIMPLENYLRGKVYVTATPASVPVDLIERIKGDIGVIEYSWFGAMVSFFAKFPNASKQFCSEWICKIIDINFEHLNRGVYPVDLYNAFTE